VKLLYFTSSLRNNVIAIVGVDRSWYGAQNLNENHNY